MDNHFNEKKSGNFDKINDVSIIFDNKIIYIIEIRNRA